MNALTIFDDRNARNGPSQMAADEALLQSLSSPTLRIYQWSSPVVSLGYFTPTKAVPEDHRNACLIRRWTGGGLVVHTPQDFTYALILPQADGRILPDPRALYSATHQALADALLKHGIEVEKTVSENAAQDGLACFGNPVPHDLLLNGTKIAGAAQRRTRLGLLQQGSLQLPPGVSRPNPTALALAFAGELANEVHQSNPQFWSTALQQQTNALVTKKYGHPDWIHRV